MYREIPRIHGEDRGFWDRVGASRSESTVLNLTRWNECQEVLRVGGAVGSTHGERSCGKGLVSVKCGVDLLFNCTDSSLIFVYNPMRVGNSRDRGFREALGRCFHAGNFFERSVERFARRSFPFWETFPSFVEFSLSGVSRGSSSRSGSSGSPSLFGSSLVDLRSFRCVRCTVVSLGGRFFLMESVQIFTLKNGR